MDLRLLILLVLFGCTHPNPDNGKVTDPNIPQATEQCQAQPDLVWCHSTKAAPRTAGAH